MSTQRRLCFAAGLLGLAFALPATAAVILPPGSTWEYTFTNPTGDASWHTTTGTAGWLSGPAPFSDDFDAGEFSNVSGTPWVSDGGDTADDLWVRLSVNLTGWDLSSIMFHLGVDNGFKLYANGNLVAEKNEEGYTSRWEYVGSINPGDLNSGMNVIAVALEDHGGRTAFDMQLTGERGSVNAVPDGATTALLLLGGIGAAAAARRHFAPSLA